MDQSKVDMFIMTQSNKFPSDKIPMMRKQMENVSDEKYNILSSVSYHEPVTMLLFSIFLGGLGVDRFMLGQTGLGVAKLLTCGGLGVWAFIDMFLIMGETRQENYKKFAQAISY